MKNFSYKIAIEAVDKATKPITKMMNKIDRKFSKFGRKAQQIGGTLTKNVTAPIAGIGVASLKAGFEFEKSMNKVSALTKQGFDTKSFKEMETLALKLGSSTQFSASQAADAMAFLGMAGWDTQKIMQGLPAVLDLSAASGTDLARSADIMSNIMGSFSIKAGNAAEVADVLAAATSSSNVDMEMLAETMKFSGRIAKDFGMSLSDTAAAAGILGNVGVQGSMAGTGIRKALTGLAVPTGKAAKVMRQLGISVKDSQGKLRPFADIMGEFGTELKSLPGADRLSAIEKVFGRIGMVAASELSEQAASGELANFAKRLSESNGAAKQMAGTMNSGMVGAWNDLKSAVEGALIELNKNGGLKELFVSVAQAITRVARAIGSMNPETMKMIAIAGGVLAALGPIVFVVGKVSAAIGMLASSWGFLLPILKFGAGVIGAVVGAIGIIPLAIGAAIAAIARLIYAWDDVKNAFTTKGFTGGIKSFFGFGDDEEDQSAAGGATGSWGTGAREAVKNIGSNNRSQGTINVEFGQAPFPIKTKSESEGMDLFTSTRMGPMLR